MLNVSLAAVRYGTGVKLAWFLLVKSLVPFAAVHPLKADT